ncbi:MAG: DNA-formamidopyrimidine glycosylase [Thermoleophilaceae bacterium]|nr:DNA-formamidopyrimidine glycosylase [Thermoleophilaceae bacterium]
MPELPEVEITARRLTRALGGQLVESTLAPGMVTMRTFAPPLEALAGVELERVGRIGKLLVVQVGDLALLIHLMSAGRLQLFEKRASLRDKRSRLLLRFPGERELRLREFGTQQRAWAKLLPVGEVEADEAVATLGPEAWPAPPLERFAELIDQPRHLHPLLRDQRVIAGIGRSWVDEILWETQLSPFRQGSDLDEDEVARLRSACEQVLDGAIEHYERVVGDSLPDKAPMPLKVHRRHGQPCPRCGATLEAVFFKDHVTTYCPAEQTSGRVLKDRRLSRLLR